MDHSTSLVDDLERRGDRLCAAAIAAHDTDPVTAGRLVAEAIAVYDDARTARELTA